MKDRDDRCDLTPGGTGKDLAQQRGDKEEEEEEKKEEKKEEEEEGEEEEDLLQRTPRTTSYDTHWE